MSDGIFAIIFALGGLGTMAVQDCPSGCLALREAVPAWGAQSGQVLFQEERAGGEFYVTRDLGLRRGPFQPVLGASAAESGAVWAGAGFKWRLSRGGFFLESSFMPGLYGGDGPDLGSPLEFRSGLAAGWTFGDGASVAVAFDHRSNGDLADLNPGLETLGLRLSVPLR